MIVMFIKQKNISAVFGRLFTALGTSHMVLVVKNLLANAGDIRDKVSMPGSGRSPGGGRNNPLQHPPWRSPWTEEPGGLQFIGSPRVRHD